MNRPPLEVADIVRAAGEAFIERNRHWLRWKHVKVLRASCWAQPHNHLPKNTPPRPKTLQSFIAVPTVAGP